MKKIILGLSVVASLASADFIGASAGVGMWQENIHGYVKNGNTINYFNKKSAETDGNSNTGNLGLESKTLPYIWAKIIHPIPFIPNVKVQYTRYDTSGTGIASGSVKIFGQTINLNDRVHTDLSINSYDATLFYEFNPVVVDLEAGIGVNVLSGTTTVKSLTTGDSSTANWTTPIPYLYARAETMSLFGFSVEGQAKYLNVSSGHYYDYQGCLKYHFPLPLIDISIAAGYKYQDIYGEDGSDSTTLSYQGGFAEVGIKW